MWFHFLSLFHFKDILKYPLIDNTETVSVIVCLFECNVSLTLLHLDSIMRLGFIGEDRALYTVSCGLWGTNISKAGPDSTGCNLNFGWQFSIINILEVELLFYAFPLEILVIGQCCPTRSYFCTFYFQEESTIG